MGLAHRAETQFGICVAVGEYGCMWHVPALILSTQGVLSLFTRMRLRA